MLVQLKGLEDLQTSCWCEALFVAGVYSVDVILVADPLAARDGVVVHWRAGV